MRFLAIAPPAVALLLVTASSGIPADRTTGFVDVPKGRLWYEAAGAGPALVLIHDGLLPSETWDGQVEPFARHFRVVRYDRRRYGRSTTETDDFSNIDDLKAVLDYLHVSSAVLLGCSSGGGLALDFAVAEKERVAALVLVGPVASGFGYSGHFTERGLRNAAPAYVGKDKDAATPDRAEILQTVVDLRRGFDLLAAREEADPKRLGYVGYSLGATMGARLLGVEARIRASVMIAGFPALTLDYSRGDRRAAVSLRGLVASEEARRAYLAALAPLDGVRFLDRRAPAPLLLQFARSDDFISRLDAALFAAAGRLP